MWGWPVIFRKYQKIFFCLCSIFLSSLKDLESSRWSGPHLWHFAWLGEQHSWSPRLASTWAAGLLTCQTGRWPSHLSQHATAAEKRIIKNGMLGLQSARVLQQFTQTLKPYKVQHADHSAEMQQGKLTSCVTEGKCRCIAIIWSGCVWNINEILDSPQNLPSCATIQPYR